MAAGTILIIGVIGLYNGNARVLDGARSLIPEVLAVRFGLVADESGEAEPSRRTRPRACAGSGLRQPSLPGVDRGP